MPQTSPSSDDVLARLEDVFARFGWRDSAAERACQELGLSAAEFDRRWPRGLDDVYVELYTQQHRMMCEEIALALLRLRRATDTSDLDECIRVVVDAIRPLNRRRSWRIAHAEYSARLLRHPELAPAFLTVRESLRHELAAVTAEGCAALSVESDVDVAVIVELVALLERGAALEIDAEPHRVTMAQVPNGAWSALQHLAAG